MPANWLFHATISVSLLIGLVMVLRPSIRRWLGANVAYWLWILPLLKLLFPNNVHRPAAVMISSALPDGAKLLSILPKPGTAVVPAEIPLEWIWLAGAAAWLFWRTYSGYRWRHFLRRSSTDLSSLPASLEHMTGSHPTLKVAYRVTDLPAAPFMTGLLRPTIYLPTDFANRFNQEQMKWVLLHELTHISRRDLWVQLLAEGFRTVFWFNPIVHVAWPLFCEDQELACDHHILRNGSACDRYEYGSALLKSMRAPRIAHTLTFSNHLKERFIMLDRHKQSKLATSCGIALCTLIGIFAYTQPQAEILHQAPWENKLVSFNLNRMPLGLAVGAIFESAGIDVHGQSEKLESLHVSKTVTGSAKTNGMTVIGADKLPDALVSIKIKDVPANTALSILLGCNGYSWHAIDGGYEIVASTSGASAVDANACIRDGFSKPASATKS